MFVSIRNEKERERESKAEFLFLHAWFGSQKWNAVEKDRLQCHLVNKSFTHPPTGIRIVIARVLCFVPLKPYSIKTLQSYDVYLLPTTTPMQAMRLDH